MKMKLLTRTNNSFIVNWWWNIDHVLLFMIIGLLFISGLVNLSASPAVAQRIGVDQLYFIKKQLIYLGLAFNVIIATSFISKENIKRFALLGFIVSIAFLLSTLIIGEEIKGSKRWLSIFGLTIQSSEFIKPFFIIFTAWLLTSDKKMSKRIRILYSSLSLALVLGLILKQPDIGMCAIISSIWLAQIFTIGVPIYWFIFVAFCGASLLIAAYFIFPHVNNRINSFLNPLEYENYQITKSIQAFNNGGWFGTGPGDGKIKQFLPDSHTDFIFPVIAEEYGFIACFIIIFLYFLILFRVLFHIKNHDDQFTVLASLGLISQITLQAFTNIGVTLNLFPTKGMTLPFISYGGSSIIASSITIGILLALTKRQFTSNLNMNRERWY